MKRRTFLRSICLTGLATILPVDKVDATINSVLSVQKSTDLVAVMGGEPDEMLMRALAEMGGINKFVRKGQKVVIKPNIGWDKTPEMAANTNPDLIAALVRECLKAGAKEVIVFDHTCDNWQKAYANSGIASAVEKAGGMMMPGNDESMYVNVALPNGVNLKNIKIHRAIEECDVWINVPILKNHGGPKMTISMKNLMGIVWDRGFFHKNNIHQCIADCCTYSKKPVLNIVDAYRVMKANGPQGKSVADAVLTKALFASRDMVAVDTAATKFFNQVRETKLDDVQYLSMAEKLKVGTTRIETLNVKRIKLD